MMSTITFLLKYKFSYIYDGYQKFCMVDEDEEKIYDIDKMDSRNVYLWEIAKVGDKITARIDHKRLNIETIS